MRKYISCLVVCLGIIGMGTACRAQEAESGLPEKTALVKGKHVCVELMPSHFEKNPVQKKMLGALDKCYLAMRDLTGYIPDDGKMLLYREIPKAGFYGGVMGAGKEVMMNTLYIDDAIKMFGEGNVAFGWVHEMGHYFDILGKWYYWNGATVEWQGNWKLTYAIEAVPLKIKWSPNKNIVFQPKGDGEVVSGRQFNDSYFLFYGDRYLSDPTKKWDAMASDDFHSFFLRIVRAYGWEPFKRWYRTYDRFEKLGLKEPDSAEGKVNLICAILSKECGADLIPAFQIWRMPVTAEAVKAAKANYPVD